MDCEAFGAAVWKAGKTRTLVIWALSLVRAASLAQEPDPAIESERARQLMVSRRAVEAVPIYDRLVRAYPLNAGLLLNLTIAEFSAERYHEAAEHALAVLKLQPDLAPANLFLGASYIKLGEPSRALDPLRKAIKAEPGDRNAGLMLGEALLGSKLFEEALGQFRKAAELLPENPRVWYGLGRTYDALAEIASRELQTGSPKSSYWLTLEGDSYLRQRRFASALSAYREGLAYGPVIPGIHAGLAEVYRQTAHPQWAEQEEASEKKVAVLKQSAEAPPAPYVAYKSYRELAAEAYGRLSRFPESMESHLHRAGILDAAGQHREAAVEWRAALSLAPADRSVSMGLSQSLYDSGDYEAVLKALAELVRQNSASAEAHFLYGASLLGLERPEAAIRYLEAAVERDPQLQADRAALGQALLQAGRAEQAIPYLREAISTDPDGSARFQLFRAYQLTGKQLLANKALTDYRSFRASLEEQRSREDGLHITAPSP